MMKYKISSLSEQGSGRVNEDAALIKDNLFAVFDGAGSLVSYSDAHGRTGGYLASSIAEGVFAANGSSLEELAKRVNREIESAMREKGVDASKVENRWSTTAAALRVHGERAEWVQIGDCLILAIFEDRTHKIVTPWVDHDVPTLRLWRELAERQEKDLFGKTKDLNIRIRRETNLTHGSLNGMVEAERFLETGVMDLADVSSLILLTDGMFIPKEDPDAPEDWGKFVELYLETGLTGLLGYVRQLEESDPDCRSYLRFKRHDDATAIGIDFG